MEYIVRAGTDPEFPSYRITIPRYWQTGGDRSDPQLAMVFRDGENATEQKIAIKAYVIAWIASHPRSGISPRPPLRSIEGTFNT